MTDFVFNASKGKEAYYASLPATNDALIWVPIEATGVVSDATMKDIDDLGTLLAGASNEQTTMGRVTATGVTVTVDDTNDKVTLDCDNPVWTSVAASNATAKLLLCYDGDTTGGTDSDIVPIFGFDFAVTPAGGNITATVDAAGLADLT